MEKLRPISLWITLFTLSLTTVKGQARSNWPKNDWPTMTLEKAGFSKTHFQEFLHYAFTFHPTFNTDAIVVVKDGHLVYEGYTNGYSRQKPHALWSLGKTMLNALVGALEKQGLLHRYDFLRKHYRAIDHFGVKDIRISDLLFMSSGLQWIEEDKNDLLRSDPWFAFYTRTSYADMPAYITQRPLIHKPGTKFNYSSGDSALLVAAIRGALGEEDYLQFHQRFYEKLGMKSVAIERDQAGYLALHGLGYASPLDIARLGLLYLHKGMVDDEAIWPADWVQFTSVMAPSQQYRTADPEDRNLQNNQAYGAQIWLNKKRYGDTSLPYPFLPENTLLGLGTRGQVLMILPDEKIIMVRTATDSELFLINRKEFRSKLFQLFYASVKGARR